ncbi:hypothetical protein OEA41_007246 [Lepraria neglecta]|uniref:Uncharacterized protein n=1 Tax=Lepraria neglecta TaxID=209136 RepID=A0AAD9ZF50_9LECA|nr:hypothetical protein OEA41_007246 [Lepraria neglecta]
MSTKAVLFAGTPHRGSDTAKWAKTAKHLASFIQKDHSAQLLDTLVRGSEVLERLADSFQDIQESFAIYTLLEEIPYPKIGKIVEKDSALIGWRETQIMMHANHSDMVKFANEKENEYIQVKYIFRDIITDRIESVSLEDNGMPAPLALLE